MIRVLMENFKRRTQTLWCTGPVKTCLWNAVQLGEPVPQKVPEGASGVSTNP